MDVDGAPVAAEIGPSSVMLAESRPTRTSASPCTARATGRPPTRAPGLLDVLARAQWDHVRKLSAWSVLDSDPGDLDKLARLQALDLPGSLLSALTEIVAVE